MQQTLSNDKLEINNRPETIYNELYSVDINSPKYLPTRYY